MTKNPKASPRAALQKLSSNVPHKDRQSIARAAQGYFELKLVPAGGDSPTLLAWSLAYMRMKVIGVQSENTEAAKRRDLSAFLDFYGKLNGHLAIELWLPRDTRAFLKSLERNGRAPTTINRMFRTIRHFARWVHEQPETPFVRTGLPTAGIKELAVEEPDAKKLERRDVLRLFKAADSLVLTEKRKNSRPLRNRAILAILYYTGLRVTELTGLKLGQYGGKRFKNVRRKANVRTSSLYLHSDGRRLLQEYLEVERPQDDDGSDYVFLPHVGAGPMDRSSIFKILVRIANEATKHHGAIHMHPHRLRHTFGFEARQRTLSDAETARLLGHQSDKYVGRYARSTQAEREAILETFEVGGE
jgi:integrase/recombinase XerD